MLADVAFTVLQVRRVEAPEVTLLGLAANDSMVGSGLDAGGGGDAGAGVPGLVTTTMAEEDVEFEPV